MADIQHTDLLSASVHEPKHITDGGTGDSGKVITNSSTVSGESEYRTLVASEIGNKLLAVTARLEDVSTALNSGWVCSPVGGTVLSVHSVIDGAITVADVTFTFKVNGLAMTLDSAHVIEFSGSAAGDTETSNVTAGGSVAAGQAIQVETDGASTGAINAQVTIYIEES
jgi:hypothetical protein